MLNGNTIVVGSFAHQSVGSTVIASGNTATRPTAQAAALRYNTTTGKLEVGSDPFLSGSVSWNPLSSLTSISASGNGISASTVNGVTTVSLAGESLGQAGLNVSGLFTRTAANTYTARTISGSSGISIVNGDGVAGNPTLSIKTTGVTTGIVSSNVAVTSSGTSGQTLLSTGSAGAEATWGALNLASSSAVTGVLPLTNGGTGGNTAQAARTSLGAAGIYRGTITGGNTTTVVHGLGQQFNNVQVIDNTNSMVLADNVVFTNSTQLSIDLTSYSTGTVFNVVIVG